MSSSALPIPTNLRDYILKYENVNLNSTTPVAPGGKANVAWQSDEFGNISANVSSGGGGTPGGSTSQIQYNNSGDFAGAPGGTTDGNHFALGAGSVVDGAPVSDPVLNGDFTASTVEVISETSTAPNGVNGLYIGVSENPVGAPIPNSTPYGVWVNIKYNQDATTGAGNAQPSGMILSAESVGNANTGVPVNLTAFHTASVNSGNGDLLQITSNITGDGNVGNGNVGYYTGINQNYSQVGSGTTNNAYGYIAAFGAEGGTINHAAQFYGDVVFMGGGTIGEYDGIFLNETAVAGVTTPYQIHSVGTAPSLFMGPMIATYFGASAVYSAAGTPLPAASVGLTGARAVVSDATLPTWMGTYTSGGAVTCPVFCNGTTWLTA
jgi:hypothetical protein